ncbi:MAG: pyridoxal phosphate-dependent aminotransferase [Sphingomonadales bacterium]
MAFIADKLSKIKPSATMSLSAKVAELKRMGKDIIALGAGEPNFDTPDHIKEAGIEAIKSGKTKYTTVDGIFELKEAIQKKFKRDNNLEYGLDQITVNCGGKHTIYNTLFATLNEGDEVIIPAPYWVSYPDMVLLCGGKPKFIDAGIEQEFKITPSQLEAAITPKTKWFMFNSPSNPTGACYSEKDIKALGKVLEKHPNVYILADDIYEHLVYDDFEFFNIAQVCPRLFDRTLTMNGVAKGYSMTGWRLGYGGGPSDLIKAIAKVQGQSTSNPCSITQWAAVEALGGPQEFLTSRVKSFQDRRDLVVKRINEIEGLSCPNPKGAFYIYISLKDLLGKKTPDGKVLNNDLDVATYWLESEGIAAVHGEAFGLSPFIRISYATSMELLVEAMNRIGKAVKALS